MNNEADSTDRRQAAGPTRQHSQEKSIKRRVIRLVLVPGVVAVVLWLVASGYLVATGLYDREVANGVRNASIPAVTALSSIQRERRLSIAYLAHRSRDSQGLTTQRQQTDQRLSELRTAADSALSNAPESILTQWKALSAQLDQIPATRSAIDAGSADEQRVHNFYNGVIAAAISLFDTQARVVPDVTATQGGIAATEVFRASDLMSRAGSIVAGAFGSGTLSRQDYLEFANLVGAYRAGLAGVAPNLRPSVRERYEEITARAAWRQLAAAENALIVSGPWTGRIPAGLPLSAAGWEAATTEVSDALIELTITQADEVSAEALRTGNRHLLTALLGSLLALTIALAAIVWAVRQSQVLVDRALSVRLAQLGRDAAAVVDQRLPDMMDRLRRREKVDPEVELPAQDYGRDEIGQLADVLNRSMRAAVGAAVDEATTRAAGITMLMGVARRPQRPLQRGLQVIEDLQNRIGDEKLLAELFDIHHQLAQTRRFLENLIILSGGQSGRRFRKPVQVRRMLLAAVGETQQYRRITLRHTPDAALVGTAVAGTIHLLAELLDNALAFSPPESDVWISCSRAKHGIVVEIEDAGVGMSPEDLDRVNELLATAPTPEVTALKDGAQVGLWVVAELAKRVGIRVTLRTSAYGGLLAIVLLPNQVIAAEDGPVVTVADIAPGAPALPVVGRVAMSSAAPARAVAPASVAALPASDAMAGLNGSATATQDIPAGHRVARRPVSGLPGAVNAPSPAAEPGLDAAVRPPLPQRRPQEHLAPELQEDAAPANAAPDDAAEPARSPEQARNRFARYQAGRRAGSSAGNDDTLTRN